MLVARSHGSPTTIWSKADAPASTNSSNRLSWTSKRANAAQPWPALRDQRRCISTATLATSTSGMTMLGDLPPSSSVTPARLRAACSMMSAPTPSDPVNDTRSTSGCEDN